MPITPVGLTATIAAALVSTGHIGPSVPQFANGVASGVFAYLTGIVKPITVDSGVVGVGVGATPLLVPTPLITAGLTQGFAAMGIVGPFAPLTILGLSIGLTTGFAQGLITTAHTTVGVGAGVVRFQGGSAIPAMIAGFATAGMVGPGSVKKATAIGIALDTTFAAYTTVTPIAGGAGPAPSVGVGFGSVV
jgi:hypothetical protein